MARIGRGLGRAAVSAALAILAASRPAAAADTDWKASAALDYESGDYGTGTRLSTRYVPLTLKRYWGDAYGSFTAPWISETTNGTVTNVDGRLLKIRRGRGSSTTTTHSGLGDMILRGGYGILREDPQPFDLTAVAKVKLPTASRSDGLGTGEVDEGAGLEFGKKVVEDWTLLADVYYTFIGSPPGTSLKNETAFDFGFSHPLRADLTLTGLYEQSTALVSGESDPQDLRALVDWKLDDLSRLAGGVLVGLSNGSPDYGFTFGGSRRF
ncbi:MAG TPA: transporter [Elusimicrobiota bacterium]|nr:transporter [Elusimicrobiota bacterium]